MRWRNLEEGQKVYTHADGRIVGRVIPQENNGVGAYHIIPDPQKRNTNKRVLLGHFADTKQAQKAVERHFDNQQ